MITSVANSTAQFAENARVVVMTKKPLMTKPTDKIEEAEKASLMHTILSGPTTVDAIASACLESGITLSTYDIVQLVRSGVRIEGITPDQEQHVENLRKPTYPCLHEIRRRKLYPTREI